ncbi:MAG TPA: hydrogenase maturation nickel metallochaperone HypA [Rhizomicrobium sp.]|nr:hydrogenase maturation nickel metallochaperone HypA [Rhizomicrobium sp.]
MHEASLMKNLMKQILELAEGEEAKAVTAIQVWLGALSHMSPAHFTEHFEEASAGTIAEGAQLDIVASNDANDPNAQEIILQSISVDA